jgi:death-on-curing protein
LPNEPRWLSLTTVVDINRALVAVTGERHFLRDQGLLESALARSQNAFAYGEEDVVALAVRLLAGLAMVHAFEQGNKRTAFVAMTEFLMTNGYDLALHDNSGWADEVITLVEHRTTEADFVQAIRPFVIARLLR